MKHRLNRIFPASLACLSFCFSLTVTAEQQDILPDIDNVTIPASPVIEMPPETLTHSDNDSILAAEEASAEQPATPEAPPEAPPVIDKPQTPTYAPQQQATEEIDDISTTEGDDTVTVITKEEFESWTDTRPKKVKADWLQLTTGEWLRGRIIIMQKENLEFDSDELDELQIEWKKVRYIRSYEPYSLRFDDNIQAVGIVEITQDEIHVESDYDDLTFKRSDLQSIASGKNTEISKWTNKVTFSANLRRGNTNQFDFTSKISARRRTVNSRLLLDYLGTITEVENTETINNHRINGNYDIFVSRDLFLTLISAEFYRDPFQNIERRRNIGVAVGYTLINTNESEWDISGGPAYQKTTFVSVQPGESSTDSATTLILSTRFDTELNSRVDLEGSYSVTLGDEKTGNYTHHSLLTIETELTDKLDFDVTMVWDRVQSPVQTANGVFPEQDDLRLLIGLGYDL